MALADFGHDSDTMISMDESDTDFVSQLLADTRKKIPAANANCDLDNKSLILTPFQMGQSSPTMQGFLLLSSPTKILSAAGSSMPPASPFLTAAYDPFGLKSNEIAPLSTPKLSAVATMDDTIMTPVAPQSQDNNSSSSSSNSSSSNTVVPIPAPVAPQDPAIQQAARSLVSAFRSGQRAQRFNNISTHLPLLLDAKTFGLIGEAMRQEIPNETEYRSLLLPIEAMCSVSRLLGAAATPLTTREQFTAVAHELVRGFKPQQELHVWMSQAAFVLEDDKARASEFIGLGPFWIKWCLKYENEKAGYGMYTQMSTDLWTHPLNSEHLGTLAAMMLRASETRSKKRSTDSLFAKMGSLILDSLLAQSDHSLHVIQRFWNYAVFRTNPAMQKLKQLLMQPAYNPRLGIEVNVEQVEEEEGDTDQKMGDATDGKDEKKTRKRSKSNPRTAPATSGKPFVALFTESNSTTRKRKKTAKMTAERVKKEEEEEETVAAERARTPVPTVVEDGELEQQQSKRARLDSSPTPSSSSSSSTALRTTTTAVVPMEDIKKDEGEEEETVKIKLVPELIEALQAAVPFCYVCQEAFAPDFPTSINFAREENVCTKAGTVIAEPNVVLCVTCTPPRMAHTNCLDPHFVEAYFDAYREKLLAAAEETDAYRQTGAYLSKTPKEQKEDTDAMLPIVVPPMCCPQHRCSRHNQDVDQKQALSAAAVPTFIKLATSTLESSSARAEYYAKQPGTPDNIIGMGLTKQCFVTREACWTEEADGSTHILPCELGKEEMLAITCASCKSVTHSHCLMLQGRWFPNPTTGSTCPQLFFCPSCLPGVTDHRCANAYCQIVPNGDYHSGNKPIRQDMARTCSNPKCRRRVCGMCESHLECRECGGEYEEVRFMKKLLTRRLAMEQRGERPDEKQEPILSKISTACLVCRSPAASHLFVNDERIGLFGHLCAKSECESKWRQVVPQYARNVAKRAARRQKQQEDYDAAMKATVNSV